MRKVNAEGVIWDTSQIYFGRNRNPELSGVYDSTADPFLCLKESRTAARRKSPRRAATNPVWAGRLQFHLQRGIRSWATLFRSNTKKYLSLAGLTAEKCLDADSLLGMKDVEQSLSGKGHEAEIAFSGTQHESGICSSLLRR